MIHVGLVGRDQGNKKLAEQHAVTRRRESVTTTDSLRLTKESCDDPSHLNHINTKSEGYKTTKQKHNANDARNEATVAQDGKTR